MERNFLNFVAHLTDNCCPWRKAVIDIRLSLIEMTFVTAAAVNPSDLGWLNTHAVGGSWFIVAEDGETHIVVRFYED